MTYARASWLFLRLLGIVYFVAFWSLGLQIRGLVGQNGLLPAHQFLADVAAISGAERFWQLPTLAWISSGDTALTALCVAGCAFSLLLVAGILPSVNLLILWLLYLSLSVVGGEFLAYQWDALLLEIGFLAIGLAPLTIREHFRHPIDPPRITVRLMWWLLFRFMMASGVAKLASGDPTWRSLTALSFHFETQPIPTPLASYPHQLPVAFLKCSTLAVLVIEIGAPLLMIWGARFRRAAFVAFVALQAVIALSGNYAFFNLLTLALCLFLLDDSTFAPLGVPGSALL